MEVVAEPAVVHTVARTTSVPIVVVYTRARTGAMSARAGKRRMAGRRSVGRWTEQRRDEKRGEMERWRMEAKARRVAKSQAAG